MATLGVKGLNVLFLRHGHPMNLTMYRLRHIFLITGGIGKTMCTHFFAGCIGNFHTEKTSRTGWQWVKARVLVLPGFSVQSSGSCSSSWPGLYLSSSPGSTSSCCRSPAASAQSSRWRLTSCLPSSGPWPAPRTWWRWSPSADRSCQHLNSVANCKQFITATKNANLDS